MRYRLLALVLTLLVVAVACGESQVNLQYPIKPAFIKQSQSDELLDKAPGIKPIFVAKKSPSGLMSMGPSEGNARSVIFNLNIPKISMLERSLKAKARGFKTQALDPSVINYVRVKIEGTQITSPMYPAGTISDPNPAKDKLTVNPGLPFSININSIPYGPIRIATIESFDAAKNPIPGTIIKTVFEVANPITIIDINFNTTPAGKIMEQVLGSNPAIAPTVDLTALQTYVEGLTGKAGVKPAYTYTTHPSLVDDTNIANDLIAASGNVAALVPGPTHTMLPGTFNATIAGLVAADTAVLSGFDPASGIATNVVNGIFNLTPITPGTWNFLALSPGYTVTGAPANFAVAAGGTFNAGTITFTPATPNITSLSVTSGKVGTSVDINGTDFHPTIAGNVVTFNGAPATVTAATTTQLTVTVPASFGSTNVNVTVGSQSSNNVTYAIKPDITGVASNGTIINGTGFDPTPANNAVLYNSVVTTVNTATNTQLNVTVPGGVVGNVPLTNQVGSQISDTVMVNLALFPSITTLSQTNGTIGTSFQINGSSFDPTFTNNTVKFGTTTATVTAGNTTQLTVTVPAGIDGTQGVTVTVTSNQSNSVNFDVTPDITSLSLPNARVGDSIQINGTGFNTTPGNNIVKFGTTNATVTAATATQLTVTAPNNIDSTQGVTVQVGTQTSNSVNIDITPEITSLSQTTGILGASIQINGTGFNTTPVNNTVKFGTTNATVTAATATQLTVTVPAAIDSTQGVTVQVGTQTSNSVNFSVIPNITSLSVTNDIIGATIQINGTGFNTTAGNNTVKFGTTTAAVTAATATQLDVTVPAGIFANQPVTVQVATQTSSSSSFDVKPNITSLSVTNAPIGSTIQVNGTGFHTIVGLNTTQFNGVGATVTAATTTQLDVTVPTAANGNVTVQVGPPTSNGIAFTTEPLISITAPSAAAIVNGNTFQIDAAVTAGNAVTNVEFFYDAVSIGTDNTAPYSINWDTTAVTSQGYTLTAKVNDGTLVTSAGVAVTVNQPPVISNVNATINPVSGLEFPVFLDCVASDVDNTLVAGSYTWSVDGGPVGTFTATTGSQVYWTAPNSAGGPYTIRCSVDDGVNAAPTEQTVAVTVDDGDSTVTGNGGFQ